MKRIVKFLLPILILTLITAVFVFPSSAAEEAGYAVWNSEADYLANPERPVAKIKSNKLTTTDLAGKGYVLCYGDVVVSEQVQLSRGQKIIIDLNGYKMTATSKIIVNGSSSPAWISDIGMLTIKNGSIDHKSGQFIQPRPNSEIYFDNVDISEIGGVFMYDSSVRIVHFKDCTVTLTPTASTFLSLSSTFNVEGADRLYKDENGKNLDYVRNVVFDNTAFIDNSNNAKIVYVTATAKYSDHIDISFTNGSSFNVLRDNLYTVLSPMPTTVNVNVAKGTKFAEQRVPVEATNYKVNYYNSITVEGNRVFLGEKNELHVGGDRNPDNPELIWGASGNAEYPYMLCQNLSSVTWVNGETTVTEEGLAEGARLTHPAEAKGYYFNPDDNNNVYVDTHEGWKREGSDECEMTVTLVAGENVFYSVFFSSRVYVVEFATPEMRFEDIISGIVTDTVTARDIKSFKSGSYVYFYDDVSFVSDDTIVLENVELTFDLGGHTFHKDKQISYGSGSLELVGSTLNITNGVFSASGTNVARLLSGSTLNVTEATVLFDTAPAFSLSSGNVLITKAKVEQRSVDTDVPFAVFTCEEAGAAITVTSSEVSLAGAFATCLPAGSTAAEMKVTVEDCKGVTADSVFAIYGGVADSIPAGSTATVDLKGTSVISRTVFDLATRSDNTEAIACTFNLDDDCLFTADPEASYGTLNLPVGKSILGLTDSEYNYGIGVGDVNVKFNMSLYLGFTANFYVLKDDTVGYVETYASKLAAADMRTETIDGAEYYVASVSGISVADSLDVIDVRIGINAADGNSYVIDFAYDPCEYFAELLAEDDPLTRKLAAAAMQYITAAYAYNTSHLPDAFSEMLASEAYLNNLRAAEEVPAAEADNDNGNISLAFTTAQLYLADTLSIRLNLAEDFSGTLRVGENTFTVADGKVGELTYIQVALSAYELYRSEVDITGSAADGTAISGSYSLSAYINAAGDDTALSAMLDALFTYCYEAYVYSNGGVIPPYIDHTPPIDIEFR